MKLEQKVAIVTGAGRGIGRAIAERFVAEGAQVVIAEIDPDTGAEAARSLGNRATFIETDLADISAIDALVARTVADHGGLDILVNNAGVTRKLDFFEVTPEDWDWMHGVNARGVFFCMQRAAREMARANRGKIVNIASIAGKEGNPNASPYSAAKAGVIGLTKSLAKEVAQQGIIINAVTPAVIATEILKQVSQEHIDYMTSRIPMGRVGQPEEVAALVCWLASEECSFSTGGVFDISGGRATY